MANKYTFKVVIERFVDNVKFNIINLAKTELNNVEKKEKLDEAILTYFNTLLSGVKLSLITKWVIKNYVIKNIPVLTQIVYDLIKSRINGVTK